jgi:DDE superfamily endonuclease
MLKIKNIAICNFNETDVFFVFDCKHTINRQGAATVLVRNIVSSQRCTLMIGLSGGEYKFSPFFIFKLNDTRGGKIIMVLEENPQEQLISTGGEYEEYPFCNGYAVQEWAWMDMTITKKCIDAKYISWAMALNGPNMTSLAHA